MAEPLRAFSACLVSSRTASSRSDDEFNPSSGRITTTSAKSPAFIASPNSAKDISSSSRRASKKGS
ncbi:hypothetical protein PR002_g2439 [Phytophthora rubi]|uniref:Uncharacterized protein n=1 Tax=Phytophthora rubi TaxID=129364 RepID=A0A6A3NHU4_9STRA|nr:hypothetical protein PR002_g2439 [Phytophthora rubi]